MISHSASSSPYIRPDYLSPLSSSLDAQKSPLAMLAATCNSIGAPDQPKTIKNVELPPTSSSKKSSPLSSGGSENKRPRRSPDASSEKPERRSNDKHEEPRSEKDIKPHKDKSAEERSDKPDRKSPKSPSNKSSCASPLTRPTPSISSPFFPPNPSNAALMADPLNFASRLKQMPGSSMGMMPSYCRDPSCYGCNQNSHCAAMSSFPLDYSALSSYSAALAANASGKPFTCNWISPGEAACGKRFLTGEELFAHLRTHTNLSVSSLSSGDPLQNYANYASYMSRFPSLFGGATSRYNPALYKSPIPGVGSPMGAYGSLWPSTAGSAPGFFSPSPYSYYRPPF